MIKNIITTGCSFSHDYKFPTWAQHIRNYYNPDNYRNLAFPGAGNFYISDSLVQCLVNESFDPSETLILVMWSGLGRKDVLVSKEYYKVLGNSCKMNVYKRYYAFSGGRLGIWNTPSHPDSTLLKPIFEGLYKSSDELTMVCDTLSNIVKTKNFLENLGYNYKFMSYVNYWKNSPNTIISRNHDYSVTYTDPANPLLNNLGNNWIWENNDQDCIYEFAKTRNILGEDNFHPTPEAQKLFFEEIINPNIQEYFQ